MTEENRKIPEGPDYQMIKAAKAGDENAMFSILKFYEPQINHYSTMLHTGADGRSYRAIDDDLRMNIITRIVMKTMKFQF